MGDTFARAFVRSLAEEAGWPAVKTRKGEVPGGEAAWRRFLAACTISELGAAERALEVLAEEGRTDNE